jgi:hypothetical protein
MLAIDRHLGIRLRYWYNLYSSYGVPQNQKIVMKMNFAGLVVFLAVFSKS